MPDTITTNELVSKIEEAAKELERLKTPTWYTWYIIEPKTGIPRTFEYMLENGFKIYDENGIITDAKTNEEFEVVMNRGLH